VINRNKKDVLFALDKLLKNKDKLPSQIADLIPEAIKEVKRGKASVSNSPTINLMNELMKFNTGRY
jgi:hypothetical protein